MAQSQAAGEGGEDPDVLPDAEFTENGYVAAPSAVVLGFMTASEAAKVGHDTQYHGNAHTRQPTFAPGVERESMIPPPPFRPPPRASPGPTARPMSPGCGVSPIWLCLCGGVGPRDTYNTREGPQSCRDLRAV